MYSWGRGGILALRGKGLKIASVVFIKQQGLEKWEKELLNHRGVFLG